MRFLERTRLAPWFLAVTFPVLGAVAAGCTSLPGPLRDPVAAATDLARRAGLEPERVTAGAFSLLTFHRGLGRSARLHVYIEGDGRAFHRRHRQSRDPTPRDPVALELAARDPADAVLYIGRPCQYLESADLSLCDPRYWSTHRQAPEVIDAAARVVERALARWPRRATPAVGIVGYSGGGNVAMLMARGPIEVDWIITVAAPLDHAAWTRFHRVTPMAGSLNPAELGELRAFAQLHLVGARDEIVPPRIAEAYLEALGLPARDHLRIIPGYDHRCCWSELWPSPLGRFSTRLR